MSDRLVYDLERLLTEFSEGGWKALRVEGRDISLLLSTDAGEAALCRGSSGAAVPALTAAASVMAQPAVSTRPAFPAKPTGGIDPAWVPVVASNLGTFYRSPKPGAAPFVEIGQKVSIDTEVCLIEVMKLFTSVKAGVAGRVSHVAAADAELVEGGQVLLYIEQD